MKSNLAATALFALLPTIAGAQAHTAPNATFVADDTSLISPPTLPAGCTEFTLDNQDGVTRAHGILRVRKGAAVAEAKALVVRGFSGGEVGSEIDVLTVHEAQADIKEVASRLRSFFSLAGKL